VDLVLCLIQVQAANATVGHGLGAAPKIYDNLKIEIEHDEDWIVYHQSIGNLQLKNYF
jgi:hypothetical protein